MIEAANEVEALEAALNADEPIDLLVTDVVMPLMGGKEYGGHTSGPPLDLSRWPHDRFSRPPNTWCRSRPTWPVRVMGPKGAVVYRNATGSCPDPTVV